MRFIGPLILLFMLVACNPSAPPTLPPPTAPAAQPPSSTEIVTLAPQPAPTLTPVPTLGFELGEARGFWDLNLRYEFNGGDLLDQIRFVGSLVFEVLSDASLSGQGTVFLNATQPGCLVSILGEPEMPVSLRGEVQQGAGGLEFMLTLTPESPDFVEHFRLICADLNEPFEFEQQMFWRVLDAIDAQPYVLPVQSPYLYETSTQIAEPTGQAFQGTLLTEFNLAQRAGGLNLIEDDDPAALQPDVENTE